MQKIGKKGVRIALLFMMLVATAYVLGPIDKKEPFVCGTCLAWMNGELGLSNRSIAVQTNGAGTTDYIPKVYIGYFVGTETIQLIPEEGYQVGAVYVDGLSQWVDENNCVYVTVGHKDRVLEVSFIPEQTQKQFLSEKR